MLNKSILLLIGLGCCMGTAVAQDYYNSSAGQNVIYEDYKNYAPKAFAAPEPSVRAKDNPTVSDRSSSIIINESEAKKLQEANKSVREERKVDTRTGKETVVEVARTKVKTDSYGNAVGNQFDLAVDGAFKGQTIAVLHLYTGTRYGEQFDFVDPKKALEEKGFNVFRWLDNPPSAQELREKLKMACQLWIISDETQKLNEQHLEVIKDFFNSGRGVYIWGDNEPFYADANYVGAALLDITMSGNYYADQTVGLKDETNTSGILQNHLITTGMNYVYEGVTTASIATNEHLSPLIWASDGKVVTAVYERDGKRAIFDGGFTRLYVKWDTAGTGRYVKNAAAWLANPEKFGDAWDKEKHGR